MPRELNNSILGRTPIWNTNEKVSIALPYQSEIKNIVRDQVAKHDLRGKVLSHYVTNDILLMKNIRNFGFIIVFLVSGNLKAQEIISISRADLLANILDNNLTLKISQEELNKAIAAHKSE